MGEVYLEVDYYQLRKDGQGVSGDHFTSLKDKGRLVSVLADGLGSGVKAGVLATLTTTMASRFVLSDMDIRRAAEIILETLPVCSKRKIGYSTFTIVDAGTDGKVRVIEYDNPSIVLLRDGKSQPVKKNEIILSNDRKGRLFYSVFKMEPEDRLVFFSDGVTQSGMGSAYMPLGWSEQGVERFLVHELNDNRSISAGELCYQTARRALEYDNHKAKDDITCAALYLREPRKLLVMSGPPYDIEKDKTLAQIARDFKGRKVICGGTTSSIISRELNLPLSVNLDEVKRGADIPPTATMEGFELVTEGTITLSKCLGILDKEHPLEQVKNSPIKTLARLFLESDIVQFIVGTRINEAHQDPSLPKELEIRRNLIKHFCEVLEKKYLKETHIEFL